MWLRDAAARDVEKAAYWYEEQRSGLGGDFIRELDAAIGRAAAMPRAFAQVHRKARRVLVRRFPFAVYFLSRADGIEVIAVLHMRRDPNLLVRRDS
ncbi:type II toxin-antitoxin system RelE/ParE family toxin [Algiphilus sp.]|uniref:type II toxin-antitoxin system RelE/ParE family toxin n=1 Tax=Algiphilus sp. TaxID=1872431 RepID=UPI003BA9F2FE